MPLPWEEPLEDPPIDEQAPLNVIFTAHINATSDKDFSKRVQCSFRWFAGDGALTDAVNTGAISKWPCVESITQGESRATTANKQEATGDQEQEGAEEVKTLKVIDATFERNSPNLQASCAFIRRLAGLTLEIEVKVSEQKEDAPEAPPPDPKAKGKAPPPIPAEPALLMSFKVFVLLAPLIAPPHAGQLPQIEADFTAVAGSAGCPGDLSALRVSVRCSGPVISDAIAKHLNPMILSVDGVHRLPDERHLKQSRDAVHTVLDAFGERATCATPFRLDAGGGGRSALHGVFFVGTWRQHELREYLQTACVEVEVHDRDMLRDGSEGVDAPPSDPYGVARFSLAELLGPFLQQPRSLRGVLKPCVGTSKGAVFGKGRFTAATIFGDGGAEIFAGIGVGGKVVAPRYQDAGSYVGLTAVLTRPIEFALEARPQSSERTAAPADAEAAETVETAEVSEVDPRYERYARLVLITSYRSTTMMKQLLALVADVNARALGIPEGTIGTRILTEEQQTDPSLDIVTGFCVMDQSTRITVVEGLRNGAMRHVVSTLDVGSQPCSKKCKILFHSSVGFSSRLYGSFNLTVKQVKMRQRRLETVLTRPDVYDRAREDKDAVTALMDLLDIKRAPRLHILKANSSFPSARGVLMIETQFGAFVADKELVGGAVETATSAAQSSLNKSSKPHSMPSHQTSRLLVEEEDDQESEDDMEEAGTTRNLQRIYFKPHTSSNNEAFRRRLLERTMHPPENHVERNIAKVQELSLQKATPRPKVDVSFLDAEKHVHIYSTQKLNSAELQKRALRAKMQGKEGQIFWTYSQEFNSGCFPMSENDVGLNSVLREFAAVEAGKTPWRLPPASAHKPREVSESRREELSTPWVENELRPEFGAPKGIKGAFDTKTLGTGGAHVLQLRRVGMQEPGGLPELEPAPPQESKYPPMHFMPGYSCVPLSVDKHTRTILHGEPRSLGLCFEKRRVPRAIAAKFGDRAQPLLAVHVATKPISAGEHFLENGGTSEHIDPYAKSLSRPLVVPPLPLAGIALRATLGATLKVSLPLTARPPNASGRASKNCKNSAPISAR